MSDRELYDLLAERFGRLECIQTETNAKLADTNAKLADTNAKLADVIDTLKHMGSIQLALRVGQEHLIERVDVLSDRVDRVADRVDRLSGSILRGFTARDEQILELRERIERIERHFGPGEPKG